MEMVEEERWCSRRGDMVVVESGVGGGDGVGGRSKREGGGKEG